MYLIVIVIVYYAVYYSHSKRSKEMIKVLETYEKAKEVNFNSFVNIFSISEDHLRWDDEEKIKEEKK